MDNNANNNANNNAIPGLPNEAFAPCNQFGIEIEGMFPERSNVRVGGYHCGSAVPFLPEGWEAQSDSSIQAPRGFIKAEIVSPILKGAEGIRQLYDVLKILNEKEFKTNPSCGIHISISYNGDKDNLITAVKYASKALYACTGTKKREQGHWCQELTGYGIPEEWTGKSRKTACKYRHSGASRYHILNLTHLNRGSNRAEFRCFSHSSNPLKIITWVQICLGIGSKALKAKALTPGTGKKDYKQGHTGLAEVKRLFRYLGWCSGQDWTVRKTSWGLISDIFSRKEMMAEMYRLARKYDESEG